MSMLSSQCDELREYAKRADGTFPLLAGALRDAADTILELRDDLQRANTENAKLREELEAVGTAAYPYGRDDLKTENSKLRNLATGLYRCWLGEGCDGCPMQDSDGWCIRDLQLRELRIEVPQ